MTSESESDSFDLALEEDPKFHNALCLFNKADWYPAHDALEELWHSTDGPERRTLQGMLQIAVAQLHLQRGNRNGAIILYGEGLGRLRIAGTHHLGLDIERFCNCIEGRLTCLQNDLDPEEFSVPFLYANE